MSDAPASPPPVTPERPDPLDKDRDPLVEAWARVLDKWEEVERHEQAVVIADTLDRLGELGRRYREVREAGDERASLAERYSEAIVARALGRLVATSKPPTGKSRVEWIMIGVSIALFAAALWSMLRALG